MDRKNGLLPSHPGEIFREDIPPEVGLSVTAAAKALGVARLQRPGFSRSKRECSGETSTWRVLQLSTGS